MLFGPLNRSYILHLFRTHPEFNERKFREKGWVYAKDLPSWMRRSLLSRLHWLKRASNPVREKLFKLASTEEGFKTLRKIFLSCEMRMNSVILADPDQPYEDFDRINCSLISNTVNRKDYHKALKGAIKKARKSLMTGNRPVIPREFSWVQGILNRVAARVDSRLRELTLLQTRASGLPTREHRTESLQDWIDLVTNKPDTDIELLAEVDGLKSYIEETMVINQHTIPETHVSLGASSCREKSRKAGGKTAFARDLIQSVNEVRRLDLETGEPTEHVIDRKSATGDWLFHHSLQKKKEGYDMLSVRTSTVPEVGEKARIITIPSFFHSTILSPWAHMTYGFLATSQECRSGIRGSNQGWELSLSMSISDQQLDWMFFNSVKPRCVNSDLKNATDAAYFRAVKIVLEVAQAVMPVPTWYFEQVRELLTTERPFSAEFEDQIVKGVTHRGIFMGDHGSKTVLTLSGLAALANMPLPRISRLVGDDHHTTSPDPERCLRIYVEKLENLGYIISNDDTFVSPEGYLAEESFRIPKSKTDTTEVFTYRATKSTPPYHDFAKVKVLSDQGTDHGGFSDTVVGKIQLLGKRMGYASSTFTESRFHLASWIQDLCITALYRPEFIYFPFHLVGAGKPMLFNNRNNFRRFVKMHRQGRLAPFYADVMRKSLQKDPEQPNKYVIAGFLDHKGSDFVKVVEREFEDDLFKPFQILTSRTMTRLAPFIVNRLGKHVISETEIVQKLTEAEYLFDEENEPRRLTVKNIARESELTEGLLDEFCLAWIRNDHNLSLRKEERYYIRKDIEAILGREHPLRVTGLRDLIPQGKELSPDYRLERDREIQMLFDWIREDPESTDGIPLGLLRDDEMVLIGLETLMGPTNLLFVSDDIDFATRVATKRASSWRDPKRTWRLSVKHWVMASLLPNKDFLGNDDVFVDQGAFNGFLSNQTDDELDKLQEDSLQNDRRKAEEEANPSLRRRRELYGEPLYMDYIHIYKKSVAPSGQVLTDELQRLMS
jgi:hypothetical protein